MENFLIEYWAELIIVILIIIIIVKNAKIEKKDEELKKLSYLKSFAEFVTSGVKLEDDFLNYVLMELLKKMTDEQLQSLLAEQNGIIKKLSNQIFIERIELVLYDKSNLIVRFVMEEIGKRDEKKKKSLGN